MESIVLSPTGHAEVAESTDYVIQRRLGADHWVNTIANLTQTQARALLDRMDENYRAVRIQVMDW